MKKASRTKSSRVEKELAALAEMPDLAINTADIPEVRNWRGAVRGRFYRPIKQVVTIRLDADVVAWFKARDRKYQTAVNRALREYVLSKARSQKRRAPGVRKASRSATRT
jgi:uncharacterized protein (DUF4415 family)